MQNTYDSASVGEVWILRKGEESGLKNDYKIEVLEKGAISLLPEDESATRIIGVRGQVREIDGNPLAEVAIFGEPLVIVFTQVNFEGAERTQ